MLDVCLTSQSQQHLAVISHAALPTLIQLFVYIRHALFLGVLSTLLAFGNLGCHDPSPSLCVQNHAQGLPVDQIQETLHAWLILICQDDAHVQD